MVCFTNTDLNRIAKKFNLKFVDAGDYTYRFLYRDSCFGEYNWCKYFPEGHYKSFIEFRKINGLFCTISYNTMRFDEECEKDFHFSAESIADLESKINELILDYKKYKLDSKLAEINGDFE